MQSRNDSLPVSSGSIELRFSLSDFDPETKEQIYDQKILQENWTSFIHSQEKLERTLQLDSDDLYTNDDDLGADFDDVDDFSVQDYERLINSLSNQKPGPGDDSSLSSDDGEEEGLTSEEEDLISDDSDSDDDIPSDPDYEQKDASNESPSSTGLEPKLLNRQNSTLLPRNPTTLQVPTVEAKKRMRRIRRRRKSKKLTGKFPKAYYEFNSRSQVVGIAYLEILGCTDLPPLSNMTRTGFDMDPFVVISFGKKTFRTGWRRHTLNPVFNETLTFPVLHHEKGFSVNFTVMDKDKITLNDNVATVDFPILKILETSPKPDPETMLYDIDAMGTQAPPGSRSEQSNYSTSSTLLPESSLNTDENDYSESSLAQSDAFVYNLQNHDSSNSLCNSAASSHSVSAPTSSGVSERSTSVNSSSPTTNPPIPASSSSANDAASSQPDAPPTRKRITRRKVAKPPIPDFNMVEFQIPLTLLKTKSSVKNSPVLNIRARFLPYAALRQQFWRGLIKLFDADSSNSMNIVEISTMLDRLGATLSSQTVEGFFSKFGKSSEEELTVDELVICLEEQILKDTIKQEDAHKKEKLATEEASQTKNPSTTDLSKDLSSKQPEDKKPLASPTQETHSVPSQEEYVIDVDGFPTPKSQALCNKIQNTQIDNHNSSSDTISQTHIEGDEVEEDERLIRVVACPFCGQPRLNHKTEIDIVTHLATCASQEWSRDNLLSMSKFVSSNQARKRWYTKFMFKVTYGNYKLGANSANILVQDRETGYIQEEKMNAYVRLGIRLLYKGLKSSSMESKRIRQILKNASFKQGRKYDNPASASAIPPFVKFYNLNMDEVLLPLDKFKTFNDFFYRQLKPGARVCDAPGDDWIAVSPADCRSTYFPTITKATEIWIKGKDFSIQRLFGNAYPEMVDKFVNGSLAIFRLAPQDYHRFHIPVSGVLGEPKTIEGEYYTVNPMAIRSALDVYGENVRVLVPIQSDDFGLVMIVCVGAMMVGSTVITRKAGERVERMDELGYFRFGGSTVLALFEPNRIKFDRDLEQNSAGALETLVKVGMSIGHTLGTKEFERDDGSKTGPSLSPAEIEEMKKKANLTSHADESTTFVEGSF